MEEEEQDYFKYLYFCFNENNGDLIRSRLNARGWTEVNVDLKRLKMKSRSTKENFTLYGKMLSYPKK